MAVQNLSRQDSFLSFMVAFYGNPVTVLVPSSYDRTPICPALCTALATSLLGCDFLFLVNSKRPFVWLDVSRPMGLVYCPTACFHNSY